MNMDYKKGFIMNKKITNIIKLKKETSSNIKPYLGMDYYCYDEQTYIGIIHTDSVDPKAILTVLEVVFDDCGVTPLVCFYDLGYCIAVNDRIAKGLRGEKK